VGSQVTRRKFITLIGGVAAWPLASRAQQTDRMRRIGVLLPYPKDGTEIETRVQACRRELARLGWSEGSNVQIDERWSTDNTDLVRANATNLVALNPDVIVTVGDRVVPILTKLTRSIPIVVAASSDAIASGAVGKSRSSGRQRNWIFAL
jgi:putative tryptophan/tyrosine transport system substrate-binding protein